MMRHQGMVICLPYFQFVSTPIGVLTLGPIFMSLCVFVFFLPGRTRLFRPDGEWLACFCSWCWHGRSEVYFGKDRATEERAACPRHQEESR